MCMSVSAPRVCRFFRGFFRGVNVNVPWDVKTHSHETQATSPVATRCAGAVAAVHVYRYIIPTTVFGVRVSTIVYTVAYLL